MESRHATHPWWRARYCWAPLFLVASVGCDKELLVGVCETGVSSMPDGGRGIGMPWWSGFETGFCDFGLVGGFCYQRGSATYTLVTSPVHSGTFAAAFMVSSDANSPGTQARCVRQATLPPSAYYAAWFYVPQTQIHSGIWTLFYFQGRDSAGADVPLWDVRLTQNSNGELRVQVYDLIQNQPHDIPSAPPIPIDQWFHLEFYFGRASDATGEITVFQDDQKLLDLTGLVTDSTSWGQWYVGSYATDLLPTQTTIYVDDVTIDVTR